MKTWLLIICLFTYSFGFGPTGHQLVIYISEQNLDSSIIKKANRILAPETMMSSAMWADDVKNGSSAPWHYINLPLDKPVTDSTIQQFYSGKTNIVIQINKKIASLKRKTTPLETRKKDLKYLIHLVADLHAPLHCCSNSGNNVKVYFFPPTFTSTFVRTNLHSLWDKLIEVKTTEISIKYVGDILNGRIGYDQKLVWINGTVEKWAVESYDISKNIIYSEDYNVDTLPRCYYTKMRPVVEEQLQKAGIRLASILEDIFK